MFFMLLFLMILLEVGFRIIGLILKNGFIVESGLVVCVSGRGVIR